MSWCGSLRTHRRSLLAVDFFTVETGTYRGYTPTLTAAWVTQQARQLTWSLNDCPEPFRLRRTFRWSPASLGVGLKPPHPTVTAVAPRSNLEEIRVQRRDRLGGLLHEYVRAA